MTAFIIIKIVNGD